MVLDGVRKELLKENFIAYYRIIVENNFCFTLYYIHKFFIFHFLVEIIIKEEISSLD